MKSSTATPLPPLVITPGMIGDPFIKLLLATRPARHTLH
jgi:hypothetical protein